MGKYCIRWDYTIKEAIERIDGNKERVAVVLNGKNKVVGVVSQGDIIRALVSGKSLYARVNDIIQPSFLYQSKADMEQAYGLFRKLKITLLPIVDADFNLVGVITMDDIYCFMEGLCKN